MSAEYVPNREGIAALALDPQMGVAMMAYGKAAQAYAESISPHGESGRYSASFNAVPTLVTVSGTSRQGAMVINTAPYAHGVEWRNGQHVLARTATYIDGKSRMVAGPSSTYRRSKSYDKALRKSQARRVRPSSGG